MLADLARTTFSELSVYDAPVGVSTDNLNQVSTNAFVCFYVRVENFKQTMIVDVSTLHLWTPVQFRPSPPAIASKRASNKESPAIGGTQRSENKKVKICEEDFCFFERGPIYQHSTAPHST